MKNIWIIVVSAAVAAVVTTVMFTLLGYEAPSWLGGAMSGVVSGLVSVKLVEKRFSELVSGERSASAMINPLTFNALWSSPSEKEWHTALGQYWGQVSAKNLDLEKRLDQLNPNHIKEMNPQSWFLFLRDEYYPWKYTDPRRLKTTTQHLKKHVEDQGIDHLYSIRDEIFAEAEMSVESGLKAAKKIGGLGTAGASGLLSLLFPHQYGTVDQFVVKRFLEVSDLPEIAEVRKMNPQNISLRHGVLLIEIMQRKAQRLNEQFGTDFWTPRKIDMVMWGIGR